MSVELKKVLNREFKTRGLLVNKVARACKIPQSVLHGWCSGVKPSAKNLHHILSLSSFLGISVSELLFDDGERKTDSKILFNSEFCDGEARYKLTVEKVK